MTADREEANDLLQETSLKALDNEEKFTPDTNFKGWMYTIMRNLFINNYRKAVRDQTYVDQTDNLFYLNQSIDLADESTESSHDLKEIRRVVNALPRNTASRSPCMFPDSNTAKLLTNWDSLWEPSKAAFTYPSETPAGTERFPLILPSCSGLSA